ncbi:MAG: hypothetical protein RR646_03615 [Erysipelotrichaceae bacterium]
MEENILIHNQCCLNLDIEVEPKSNLKEKLYLKAKEHGTCNKYLLEFKDGVAHIVLNNFNLKEDEIEVVNTQDIPLICDLYLDGCLVDKCLCDLNIKETKRCSKLKFIERSSKSLLRICKYLRDENNVVCRPNIGNYYVALNGCGCCINFVLRKENNYCIDISSLCIGKYCIEEIPLCNNSVSYIVNGSKERKTAEIYNDGCSQFQVDIINSKCNVGKIKITKFIKDGCHNLIKPNKDQSYRIQVKGLNFCEEVVLDCKNGWSYTLCNLHYQIYEIREISCNDNEDTCYIINDLEKKKCMVSVCSSELINVSIINVKRIPKKYCLSLNKEIVISGVRNTPCRPNTYEFEILGKCFKEIICLNDSNNYCRSINLLKGSYEIKESNQCNSVKYIINDEELVGNKFEVCKDISITALNIIPCNGALKISAKQKIGSSCINLEGNVCVSIEAKDYFEKIILNEKNDYTRTICNLDNGLYKIKVLESKYNCEEQIVEVNCKQKNVNLILSNKTLEGKIKLEKIIKNDGVYSSPNEYDKFNITIKHDGLTKTICLEKNNDFCYVLDKLPTGYYYISEEGVTDVGYQINGGPIQDNAAVYIDHCYANVKIINKGNTPVPTKKELTISKRIKVNGQLIVPNNGKSYEMIVAKNGYMKSYYLEQCNNYQVIINNLEPTIYNVSEVEIPNVNTTLILNGGEATSNIALEVNMNSNNNILVINEEKTIPKGTLEVYKYMLKNKVMNKPKDDEVFEFALIGNGQREYFILNKNNNWHLFKNDIAVGKYEIEEKNLNDYSVSYRVNAKPISKDAKFIIKGEDNAQVDIINESVIPVCNRLVIEIRVKDGNNLVRPNNFDEYKILLTGENFHQSYSLNNNNDFKMIIKSIAKGYYEIHNENNCKDEGSTSYKFNDEKETKDSNFMIEEADNTMIIVNEMIGVCRLNVKEESKNQDIKIVID